jgi:hypothetical protein
MSTVLPDLYKIAANATSSSIDQAIPRDGKPLFGLRRCYWCGTLNAR